MFDPSKPNCWEVYDYFQAHADRLTDPDFLQAFLTPHCLFKKLRLRGSRLRIIQLPFELAHFLVFMARARIGSYLEIGTSTGGSWFLIDSYLRAINSDFHRSVGYDSKAKLRGWPQYQARFQGCEFRHQRSTEIDLRDEQYDLALIDATHQEHWVWHDFHKVKDHARFVAFHDIVLGGGSTVDRFWRVSKTQFPWLEFIDTSLPQTCGIGVLQLRPEEPASLRLPFHEPQSLETVPSSDPIEIRG